MNILRNDLTDEEIDKIIDSYFKYKSIKFACSNKKNIQSAFFTLIKKLQNNIEFTFKENMFFDDFQREYYPNIVGQNFLYQKTNEKLLSPYKELSKYYLKNFDKVNLDSIYFLLYYYLNEMMNDFNFKVKIKICDDAKCFIENPKLIAFHEKEKYSIFNTIYFNSKKMEMSLKNKEHFINFLVSCYHELEHEYQLNSIKNEKIDNVQAVIWAKERLLMKYIGIEYYKKNYHNIFFERDARNYSYKRFKQRLEEASVSDVFIDDEALNRDSEYDVNIKHKDITNNNEVIAVDFVDIVSSEAISKHPKLLEYYPILKNIYNTDGSKKLYSEIESILLKDMRKEILKNPESTSDIVKKYDSLINEISKTDNELYIQKLCLDAYTFEKETNQESLDYTLNLIIQKMKERNISYEDLLNRVDNRAYNLLDSMGYKRNEEILEELNKTDFLKDCLIKYNSEFRKKYEELEDYNQIKFKIERIVEHSIDKYKFIPFTKNLKLVPKSMEELEQEEKEILCELEKKDLSSEDLKLYLEYVKNKYELFKSELEEEKPKRKIS